MHLSYQFNNKELRYNSTEFYRDYDNPYELKKKDYTTITKTFNHFFMSYIAKTGQALKIPKIGPVTILRRKHINKGYIKDYQHFLATGEDKYYTMEETYGYVARWRWMKNYPFQRDESMKIWNFKPSRDHKRALREEIVNDTIFKYFEYD